MLRLLLQNFIAQCDAPIEYQYTFQDPATPMFEGTIYLHDLIWTFLFFIVLFVTWMIFRVLGLFKESCEKKIVPVTQNVDLETIWTVSPAIILTLLGGNSLTHLYSVEENLNSSLDVTIIGNQWFWIYEFIAFTKKISFESHMIAEDDLMVGELRNLEVDNPLIIPSETNITLYATSNDVIHSWAVPSLGIKIDAVPGRMNRVHLYAKREGRFYGQCSEICGKGHALMPIVVVVVDPQDFLIYMHYMFMDNTDFYKSYIKFFKKP